MLALHEKVWLFFTLISEEMPWVESAWRENDMV